MPKYIYQAINENGITVSGTLEAESVEVANFMLISRNLIPSKMNEQSKSGDNHWLKAIIGTGKVKVTDLIMFTKQFHSMMVAGIPMLRIMSILEDQTESKGLKRSNIKNDSRYKSRPVTFRCNGKEPQNIFTSVL